MDRFTLRIRAVNRKCLDSAGEWDGTWGISYEWLIDNEDGVKVRGRGGYLTYNRARQAAEAAWIKFKKSYERKKGIL